MHGIAAQQILRKKEFRAVQPQRIVQTWKNQVGLVIEGDTQEVTILKPTCVISKHKQTNEGYGEIFAKFMHIIRIT